ncbi:transposase [Amaricoccus sp.]|uniref:transposase n=1 Tax=Amaricoccus sp. TaxID=1872485 RepID=UPI003FA59076
MNDSSYEPLEDTVENPVDPSARSERRRRWASAQKLRIVQETLEPGAVTTLMARHYGISTGLLYTWRKQALAGALAGWRRPPSRGVGRNGLVKLMGWPRKESNRVAALRLQRPTQQAEDNSLVAMALHQHGEDLALAVDGPPQRRRRLAISGPKRPTRIRTVSQVTTMPRSASSSSTSRKLELKRRHNQIAYWMMAFRNRKPRYGVAVPRLGYRTN